MIATARATYQEIARYLAEYGGGLIQSPVPKVGMAAMVAIVAERAFPAALYYVLALWAVDFALGVLRALAAREALDPAKARHGLIRLFVIPLLAIAAALVELIAADVVRLFGESAGDALDVGLGGKFVLLAVVAMAWEETVSIQRNGRHFYRAIRLRINLPWEGGKGGNP